jgi:K+-sensing histidine kinase KdpD
MARYFQGLLLVLAVTVFSHSVQGWISEDNLMLWFLVSVILAALYWGKGPALLVGFLSFLALDFGVFHPAFALGTPNAQYFLSLFTFLGVGFVISRLADDLRHQVAVAKSLHDYAYDLNLVTTPEEVHQTFVRHTQGLFGKPARLTLEGAADAELDSFVQPARLALQKLQSQQERDLAMLERERERVQNALLNSLSHDLQTPLASLAGSLQVVSDSSLELDQAVRQQLLQLAKEQTERLRHLVTNLLQMTRLDGPGLRLNHQAVEVDELLGVVMEHCPTSLRHRIELLASEELPDLEVDYVLVVNLLVNLLENAHKYAPEGSPIQLLVEHTPPYLHFCVRDRGPGMDPKELPFIFDKFYQGQGAKLSGSGLGLFIAKGIVTAHQGRIEARLREGGGLEISCWLPTLPLC